MEEALKLIITKCDPQIAEEAIRTLAALQNKSPVVHIRYLHLLQRALANTEWTPEERAILAEAVEPGEQSGTRDFILRVRLTQAERARLQELAEKAGLTMSEYIRRLI